MKTTINSKVLTDKDIEKIWNELEDATMREKKNGELVLCSKFYIWKAGTTQNEIWNWFDKNYSKGVGYLVEEYEG